MLLDDKALEYLVSHSDIREEGRSSFWHEEVQLFSVTADGEVTGETVLGSVSRKTGMVHNMAHWFLQWPFRCMGKRYRDFDECERLGRLVARRQGRQFTHDMIRQVLTLALIRHHIPMDDSNQCNLVIGDGYGVLSSLFLLAAPERRTILVNLTKSLVLDLAYIRKAVPDLSIALARTPDEMDEALIAPDVRLIAVQADNAHIITGAAIGIAANVVSMQEMEPRTINEYFRIMRTNKCENTAFYCCNKLRKKFSDGSEARFLEYPWRSSDRILDDNICLWSQWYYGKRPPFWFYRFGKGRVIWHRLAILKREIT